MKKSCLTGKDIRRAVKILDKADREFHRKHKGPIMFWDAVAGKIIVAGKKAK